MAKNLRSRLQRIREQDRKPRPAAPAPGGEPPDEPRCTGDSSPEVPGPLRDEGWEPAGFKTLKRTVTAELPIALIHPFPDNLPILVPDFFGTGRPAADIAPESLLFFDLETTGLSGGAGTMAFLAAFGRFERPKSRASRRGSSAGEYRLRIDQYLLLDYPGECDFLEVVLGEFTASPELPLMVSYNGKTFDSQILRTRCLMNGMRQPVCLHADLLHPVRRLWRPVLASCSQGEIERFVLGIERKDDMPGAMAPEIWFDFLRTGETQALSGICDHNIHDIRGLASIFAALVSIAENPLDREPRFRYDAESLAIHWRRTLSRVFPKGQMPPAAADLGTRILESAAARNRPRALHILGRTALKNGDSGEGRDMLESLAESGHPPGVRALALRDLAVDAEWRLKDRPRALAYTDRALALEGLNGRLRSELSFRRDRLLKYLEEKGTKP
ncbi:ribonuclease H-like domain-containing protein [Breznakiella homolactica]|uniref:Ribonuclease H-like domain-containing protein n=1 Tax=Breznakiella homolactica TaxID=2798577 RepID=A0A7T7XL27_9SPIR|nr:ribonuclease H-like domain-containing protein [Breznakiella homolactica]QQO08276.1 ribonuclease H-like domain-containing protein [Breznakiella homolactica]